MVLIVGETEDETRRDGAGAKPVAEEGAQTPPLGPKGLQHIHASSSKPELPVRSISPSFWYLFKGVCHLVDYS